jgi:hypothetical protein
MPIFKTSIETMGTPFKKTRFRKFDRIALLIDLTPSNYNDNTRKKLSVVLSKILRANTSFELQEIDSMFLYESIAR